MKRLAKIDYRELLEMFDGNKNKVEAFISFVNNKQYQEAHDMLVEDGGCCDEQIIADILWKIFNLNDQEIDEFISNINFTKRP